MKILVEVSASTVTLTGGPDGTVGDFNERNINGM